MTRTNSWVSRLIGLALAAGLIHVLRDAAERAERSERGLRAVVENASDAVAIVDVAAASGGCRRPCAHCSAASSTSSPESR